MMNRLPLECETKPLKDSKSGLKPPTYKHLFTHYSPRNKQTKAQRFIPMWDIDRQNEQDKCNENKDIYRQFKL